MEASDPYTPNHPRWYRRRVSTYWWLWQPHYFKFIVRELTSVAVAWAVFLVLLEVYALGQGPAAVADLLEWFRRPWVLLMDLVALAFVLFHSITWFNLAPKAMPIRMGGRRVSDALLALPNYVAWAAVSGFVAWRVLR